MVLMWFMYVFAGCSLPSFLLPFLPSFLPSFFPLLLQILHHLLLVPLICLLLKRQNTFYYLLCIFKSNFFDLEMWLFGGQLFLLFPDLPGDLYIMRKMETNLCAARKRWRSSSSCCFYLICPFGPPNRFYDFSNVGISIGFSSFLVTSSSKNAYKMNTFAVSPAYRTCHLWNCVIKWSWVISTEGGQKKYKKFSV